mgnify:CR=1 FL=1
MQKYPILQYHRYRHHHCLSRQSEPTVWADSLSRQSEPTIYSPAWRAEFSSLWWRESTPRHTSTAPVSPQSSSLCRWGTPDYNLHLWWLPSTWMPAPASCSLCETCRESEKRKTAIYCTAKVLNIIMGTLPINRCRALTSLKATSRSVGSCLGSKNRPDVASIPSLSASSMRCYSIHQ